MDNAINKVNAKTVKKCGSIMGKLAGTIFVAHADSIIERLQEEALDNEGSTQLTVPMKMVVVWDEGEFRFQPSIDLRKTTKVTFEEEQVTFNPNQPDLFEGKEAG